MKKFLRMILIAALALGLVLAAGCGGEKEPYSDYDLTEYITLPDYEAFTAAEPEVVIDDSDIDEEIQARLVEAATTENVIEGTVDEGDTITISFKGTLADGSTQSGLNSDSSEVTLGEGRMIEGFEEGLYGATIGETVTLDLTFPDPYTNNEELSGQDVTFEVTVLGKSVQHVPDFNDEFVRENSDYETTAEYRAAVAEELSAEEYENQLADIKQDLYSRLIEETTVQQYPEKEVDEWFAELDEYYHSGVESSGSDWDSFLEAQEMTQEEYEEQIRLYAEEYVKQEMVIYLFAQVEGLEVTDEEYEQFLADNLKSSGFESEEDFEEYAGMSLDEYAEMAELRRSLLLNKELDTLYDRLTGEE